jgi:hypothetical protein
MPSLPATGLLLALSGNRPPSDRANCVLSHPRPRPAVSVSGIIGWAQRSHDVVERPPDTAAAVPRLT